eukprot:m51a1_g2009 hypothetical protein (189) ;mRNA; f:1252950-1253588
MQQQQRKQEVGLPPGVFSADTLCVPSEPNQTVAALVAGIEASLASGGSRRVLVSCAFIDGYLVGDPASTVLDACCACELVLESELASRSAASPIASSPIVACADGGGGGSCGGLAANISCHRCRSKKSMCFVCPSNAKHKFCESCLRRHFGLGELSSACPMCTGTCGCTKCRSKTEITFFDDDCGSNQ